MASSPLTKYPGATTEYWYQSRCGGTPVEVHGVVLHTSEGRALPDCFHGSSARVKEALRVSG